MKQYRLEKADEGYSLSRREVPVPAPGPQEVLVRVRACSLNRRDVMVLRAQYGGGDTTGRIPLSDGAGEVAAVGAKVARFKPGERVAATFFQRWNGGKPTRETLGSSLGGAIDGMLSEYVVLHEDGLVRLPEHLSFAEGSTLPCAGVTAWAGLFTRGALQGGDTVLLEGTGGVSIFGLQFAVASGARAIITSSSDAKLERATAMGAWRTVNYRTHPEWDKQVRALTEEAGVDHVLEVGGADTLPKALACLGFDAHLAYIGGLTGWTGQLPIAMLSGRNARVSGILVGSRADFEAMNAFIARHALRPIVDRTFTFDSADAAYRHMESGSHFGKIVIEL
ncbi:MAG TPA: NAD(P)-dependent alcohol dehydrogenase [Steroidobacteraceae bacterium]|nr:NAD(P)-dependent alcohol dehydrogenase [Steroidobacteraceae bacterium]